MLSLPVGSGSRGSFCLRGYLTQQTGAEPGLELPSHSKVLACYRSKPLLIKGESVLLHEQNVPAVIPPLPPPCSFLGTSLAVGPVFGTQGRGSLFSKKLSLGECF